MESSTVLLMMPEKYTFNVVLCASVGRDSGGIPAALESREGEDLPRPESTVRSRLQFEGCVILHYSCNRAAVLCYQ